MGNKVNSNFFYTYLNDNLHTKKRLSKPFKSIIYLIVTLIIILCFIIVGFNFAPNGWTVFVKRINEIFTFKNTLNEYNNQSLFFLSLKYLWYSIQGVIIGTTFGLIFAFFTATLVNQYFIKNKIFTGFFKIFIATLRAFPAVVFIYFYTDLFSKNLALVLVLFWFSWIWIHKYLSEIYLSLNYFAFNLALITGSNKISAYLKTIWPQINNRLISLYLYSFDANVRWSSLLSTLGLAGIGELIEKASDNQYESMGIPILIIMIFMIFLELLIFLINHFILNHKSFVFKANIKKRIFYFNYKSLLKVLLFVFVLVILLIALITLNWKQSYQFESSFIKQVFTPNWNIINQKSDLNLFLDILKLFAQVIVIMFLVLIFSFILMFISCYKLFKMYALLGLIISTLIRAIPTVVLFFIFNPLYTDPSSSICIIFGIASGCVINKNITETINKIDEKVINIYQIQGYSKLNIYFKYIIPYVKNHYLALFLFEFESQFRNLITYGKYGVSAIGGYIDLYFYNTKRQITNMATFVWIAFFIVLFVILLTYLIKLKLIENKKIFIFKVILKKLKILKNY